MDDDFSRRIRGRALFSGPAGHQRSALHEIVQFVVVAGDDAFGGNHERALSLGGEWPGRF